MHHLHRHGFGVMRAPGGNNSSTTDCVETELGVEVHNAAVDHPCHVCWHRRRKLRGFSFGGGSGSLIETGTGAHLQKAAIGQVFRSLKAGPPLAQAFT